MPPQGRREAEARHGQHQTGEGEAEAAWRSLERDVRLRKGPGRCEFSGRVFWKIHGSVRPCVFSCAEVGRVPAIRRVRLLPPPTFSRCTPRKGRPCAPGWEASGATRRSESSDSPSESLDSDEGSASSSSDDGSSSSSSDEGARWRRTMKNHEGSCPGGIGNSGCLGRSGWPMRLSRAKTRRRSSRRCTNTLLAMLRGAVQTRCARRRRASAASGHCQCASGLAGGWASSCRPAARVDVRKKLASAAISRMCSTVAPALPPAPLPLRGNLPRGRSGSVRLAGRERSLREGCEINGKKLELACGTTVQIMGQMVFICGTKDERERVRHIVAVLLMEKSYVG